MGREIKVDFNAGKPAGKGKGGKGGGEVRPMQEKPAGCNTLFAGNLRSPSFMNLSFPLYYSFIQFTISEN